jgi:ABC-2 type transport system permease protein
MRKTLLILKNEIITIISRRSFWLALIGLPLVGALIFAGVGVINKNSSDTQTISQVLSGTQDTRPEGYVDLSGIIRQIPESVPSGAFVAYPNETSARQALAAGEISAFYIVPADYLQKGQIRYICYDFKPLTSSGDRSSLFTWMVQVNLAGGDVQFVNLVNSPLEVNETSLAPVTHPDEDNPLALWTPYIITILFYMLIVGSATLLLNNISKEKENRMVEVLLTSVTPRQLLTGKILGLGIVGLGQTLFWFGTSYILLNLSDQAFPLSSAIHLPVSFLVWGLVFFLLGYAIYASLMAGLGALAPNLREASQATFVITLPLMVPLFLGSSVFMQAPNSALAIVLSLFPFSAPVAMMARLSAGGVAWWQPVLSAALLVITIVIIVRTVASMFQAQELLSGQPFSLKTYLWALTGRK